MLNLHARLQPLHGIMQDGWRVMQVGVSAVPLWLALVMFLPAPTFDTAPIPFAVMERLGTEHEWGLVCAGGALLGLWGLVSKSTEVRMLASYALSVLHGTIALCLGLAAPSNTGCGVYAILAFMAYALAWKHGHARR